jgi:hypothetical protein
MAAAEADQRQQRAGLKGEALAQAFEREAREHQVEGLTGHWQINRHLVSACAKVSHETNFLCSASIST